MSSSAQSNAISLAQAQAICIALQSLGYERPRTLEGNYLSDTRKTISARIKSLELALDGSESLYKLWEILIPSEQRRGASSLLNHLSHHSTGVRDERNYADGAGGDVIYVLDPSKIAPISNDSAERSSNSPAGGSGDVGGNDQVEDLVPAGARKASSTISERGTSHSSVSEGEAPSRHQLGTDVPDLPSSSRKEVSLAISSGRAVLRVSADRVQWLYCGEKSDEASGPADVLLVSVSQ